MNRRPVVRTGKVSRTDQASSSSEDEEDAFAVLARKKNNSKQVSIIITDHNAADSSSHEAHKNEIESAIGTSQRRYHHPSAARAAKMDILLQELQETSTNVMEQQVPSFNHTHNDRAPLEKMGSYCLPGEELITANLFVGNLAPQTTEEELHELFSQFGDLSSVKIMWPRTEEERLRGRNTGFVCFMKREDASDAMDYYQESDPLNTGHRLMIRWGKDVRSNNRRGQATSIIPSTRPSRYDHSSMMSDDVKNPNCSISLKRSISSGYPTEQQETDTNFVDEQDISLPDLKRSKLTGLFSMMTNIKYIPTQHSKEAIQVIPPLDPSRHEFISTLAFYVSKDGNALEKKILECECNNPSFAFLSVPSLITDPSSGSFLSKRISGPILEEYIFYRWRVYAFAQGDGFHSWQTEPFIMLYHPQDPGVRFWIPPQLPSTRDDERTGRKGDVGQGRGERIRHRQEGRGRLYSQDDRYLLGEDKASEGSSHGKKAASAGASILNDTEMEEWNDIIHNRLSASKDSILAAMSFCFDRSTAAIQISQLLRTALLDDQKGISVDTRIARLFFLSDVLFNSQQPGVKNAYRFRDAIETMAPEIFSSLGKHGQKHGEMIGRITLNKLRNAVKAVLSAWTDWSVYNNQFIEELDAHYEGIQLKVGEERKVGNSESGEVKVANHTISSDTTVSVDSDIDGEELNYDDLIPDDIDGESLSESEYFFDMP